MEERNKVIFQLNQNNKSYSLSTSLIKDKINLVCKDETSNLIYENSFTLPELLRISKYLCKIRLTLKYESTIPSQTGNKVLSRRFVKVVRFLV